MAIFYTPDNYVIDDKSIVLSSFLGLLELLKSKDLEGFKNHLMLFKKDTITTLETLLSSNIPRRNKGIPCIFLALNDSFDKIEDLIFALDALRDVLYWVYEKGNSHKRKCIIDTINILQEQLEVINPKNKSSFNYFIHNFKHKTSSFCKIHEHSAISSAHVFFESPSHFVQSPFSPVPMPTMQFSVMPVPVMPAMPFFFMPMPVVPFVSPVSNVTAKDLKSLKQPDSLDSKKVSNPKSKQLLTAAELLIKFREACFSHGSCEKPTVNTCDDYSNNANNSAIDEKMRSIVDNLLGS